MCGLAALVSGGAETADARCSRRCARMWCGAIVHRGPDDAGEWIDAPNGVALGSGCLAILDSVACRTPADARRPPGRYASPRSTARCYNFEELRQTLQRADARRPFEDTRYRGDARGVRRLGRRRTLQRFNGMFAIAAWDRDASPAVVSSATAWASKPVYYGFAGPRFRTRSELARCGGIGIFPPASTDAALAALPSIHVRAGAAQHLRRHRMKLTPGTILTFDPSRGPSRRRSTGRRAEAAHAPGRRAASTGSEGRGRRTPWKRSPGDAVRLRMVADVPLGVFLSGGIDSSLVTALMQAQSSSACPDVFDWLRGSGLRRERIRALTVAAHLGTSHTAPT